MAQFSSLTYEKTVLAFLFPPLFYCNSATASPKPGMKNKGSWKKTEQTGKTHQKSF